MEIPVFNANSADAEQMPHSAVYDLGLHCLQIPLLGFIKVGQILRKILSIYPLLSGTTMHLCSLIAVFRAT